MNQIKNQSTKKTLKVNRVESNCESYCVKNGETKQKDRGLSKIGKVRKALTKYRITPYLISLKKRAIIEVFSDPSLSVEQACKILKTTQSGIKELEYFHDKTKRVLDLLTFTQKEILFDIELGESCAQVAKTFGVSSRTAANLVNKLYNEICD